MKMDDRGWLENPYVLVVILIVLCILAISGALMLLFAPNIMAALLIVVLAIWLMWKAPIPDVRFRVGIPIVLIIIAIMVYFWGNEMLAVII